MHPSVLKEGRMQGCLANARVSLDLTRALCLEMTCLVMSSGTRRTQILFKDSFLILQRSNGNLLFGLKVSL